MVRDILWDESDEKEEGGILLARGFTCTLH